MYSKEEIVLSFIITVLAYCLIPTIIRIVNKKEFEFKKAKIIAVINSITIYILFFILYIIMDYDKVPNIFPAILWYWVSKSILTSKSNCIILPKYSNDSKVDIEQSKQILEDKSKINMDFFNDTINPYNNSRINNEKDVLEYINSYLEDYKKA